MEWPLCLHVHASSRHQNPKYDPSRSTDQLTRNRYSLTDLQQTGTAVHWLGVGALLRRGRLGSPQYNSDDAPRLPYIP